MVINILKDGSTVEDMSMITVPAKVTQAVNDIVRKEVNKNEAEKAILQK